MANSYEDIRSLTTVELVSDFLYCEAELGDPNGVLNAREIDHLSPSYNPLLTEILRRDTFFGTLTTDDGRDDYENAGEWSCLDLVPAYRSLSNAVSDGWSEFYVNGSRPDPYLVEWEGIVLTEIQRRDEALGIPLPKPTPRQEETFHDDYDEEEVPF